MNRAAEQNPGARLSRSIETRTDVKVAPLGFAGRRGCGYAAIFQRDTSCVPIAEVFVAFARKTKGDFTFKESEVASQFRSFKWFEKLSFLTSEQAEQAEREQSERRGGGRRSAHANRRAVGLLLLLLLRRFCV